MFLKTCEKVCKQCPFSSNSMRGWLGGNSVESMLDAQQYENLFSCHMHRGDDPEENDERVRNGEIPICRGFIISATVSCKMFGQNLDGKSLAQLQDSIVITPEERSVILNRRQFREHHTLIKKQ